MPHNHSRLYQKLAKKIKRDILHQLEIGSKLPTEREIAERYMVSRTVVREAIIMLELENLVEVKKGSGIYLIGKTEIHNSSFSSQIGPFEHLQARQIVESNIAKLAAIQITKNDMLKIQDILTTEENNLTQSPFDDTGDAQFHLALAEATQNSAFVEMVQNFWEWRQYSPMWKKLNTYTYSMDYRKKWLGDHQNIFDAVYKKKPNEACDAMWQHIENVKNILIEVSDSGEDSFDRFLFQNTPVIV